MMTTEMLWSFVPFSNPCIDVKTLLWTVISNENDEDNLEAPKLDYSIFHPIFLPITYAALQVIPTLWETGAGKGGKESNEWHKLVRFKMSKGPLVELVYEDSAEPLGVFPSCHYVNFCVAKQEP